MSPGSRNAPLTISFARHENIEKWIIPDERSAGFVALGIAQQIKSPVVLCCTSGTALLNYAPAIAEAYYREIPLIVLSADRPPELIDQRDGQTIRQFESLKNHVKSSLQLPVIKEKNDARLYEEELIKGLKESTSIPFGPVHINIPFAEPFYPTKSDELSFKAIDLKIDTRDEEHTDTPTLTSSFSKVLIVAGQQSKNLELNEILNNVNKHVPVLKFPLNNLDEGITHADLFIDNQAELKPDLLITTGLSVLSKKMKQFLRAFKPEKHIHFDTAGIEVDTFQSNPEISKSSIKHFLGKMDLSQVDTSFLKLWQSYELRSNTAMDDLFSKMEFCETLAAKVVLASIPSNSKLHLSNSMPVRYADMFGVPDAVECYSNRGTSGIDGCTSTSLGTALVSEKLNVLITGDLAFLYDRNAFFNNHNVNNLRVVILNNQGGGIFRLIDGPSNLPELEEYFETRHNRTAEYICAENGLDHIMVHDLDGLNTALAKFYEPSQRSKVIEVFTNPETNQRVYKELKNYINERVKN